MGVAPFRGGSGPDMFKKASYVQACEQARKPDGNYCSSVTSDFP